MSDPHDKRDAPEPASPDSVNREPGDAGPEESSSDAPSDIPGRGPAFSSGDFGTLGSDPSNAPPTESGSLFDVPQTPPGDVERLTEDHSADRFASAESSGHTSGGDAPFVTDSDLDSPWTSSRNTDTAHSDGPTDPSNAHREAYQTDLAGDPLDIPSPSVDSDDMDSDRGELTTTPHDTDTLAAALDDAEALPILGAFVAKAAASTSDMPLDDAEPSTDDEFSAHHSGPSHVDAGDDDRVETLATDERTSDDATASLNAAISELEDVLNEHPGVGSETLSAGSLIGATLMAPAVTSGGGSAADEPSQGEQYAIPLLDDVVLSGPLDDADVEEAPEVPVPPLLDHSTELKALAANAGAYRPIFERLASEIEIIVQTGVEEALKDAAKAINRRVNEHIEIVLPEILDELSKKNHEDSPD